MSVSRRTPTMTDDVADVGERDAPVDGFDEDAEDDEQQGETDDDHSENEEDEDESEGFGMAM